MFGTNPGFTGVSILTLALGIGVNTAFFSVINAVLLRPLPYQNPSRLVYATQFAPKANTELLPAATYMAWRDDTQVFESTAAYVNHICDANLTGASEPARVNRCAAVTASFFPVLGLHPAAGRAFLPEEDRPGAPHVLILSDRFWHTHFGAHPRIIGQALTLGSAAYS